MVISELSPAYWIIKDLPIVICFNVYKYVFLLTHTETFLTLSLSHFLVCTHTHTHTHTQTRICLCTSVYIYVHVGEQLILCVTIILLLFNSFGNFAAIDGQPYCKPHFIELFKKRGQYLSKKVY